MIDMDSQGNLTELLTNAESLYNHEFKDESIMQALAMRDVRPYIKEYDDTLHFVPSNDHLSYFAHYVYKEAYINKSISGKEAMYILRKSLEPVLYDYDYIVIDTPPALGELTMNALTASDYVIPVFVPDQFCYYAVDRFKETIEVVKKETNPDLELLGIVINKLDRRRADHKAYRKLFRATDQMGYPFDADIHHRACIGRLTINGFNDITDDLVNMVLPFVKETLERIDLYEYEGIADDERNRKKRQEAESNSDSE